MHTVRFNFFALLIFMQSPKLTSIVLPNFRETLRTDDDKKICLHFDEFISIVIKRVLHLVCSLVLRYGVSFLNNFDRCSISGRRSAFVRLTDSVINPPHRPGPARIYILKTT